MVRPSFPSRKPRVCWAAVRKARRALSACAAVAALLTVSSDARAIRPFVTDDAHTVGRGRVQLETYFRRDRASLQHWVLPAVGPVPWLELTLGAVHGAAGLGSKTEKPRYALAGPLLQSKLLLHEAIPNHLPGVGIVVGGLLPAGRGGFEAAGWNGFSYLAVTQAFFKEDDLLFHFNVGLNAVSADGLTPLKATWGVGTQVETLFDFHLIGEIFSGDPYTAGSGGAFQVGFRQIYNDHLQLDGTVGAGVFGDVLLPVWFSTGVRIVSHDLF